MVQSIVSANSKQPSATPIYLATFIFFLDIRCCTSSPLAARSLQVITGQAYWLSTMLAATTRVVDSYILQTDIHPSYSNMNSYAQHTSSFGFGHLQGLGAARTGNSLYSSRQFIRLLWSRRPSIYGMMAI